MRDETNHRVLLVDDNYQIHEDFRKILLEAGEGEAALRSAEEALFGDEPAAPFPTEDTQFVLESAFQGEEALKHVDAALEQGHPFAMAFVDMRMPPGWDGVETIERLWKSDPDLQVVVCTAYSDYTWSEMVARLGKNDRLLILKKPFDPIEVRQLAIALTEKWNVTLRERMHLQAVMRAEQEARAYAASLETVNRALQSSMASAEAVSRSKSEFLLYMARDMQGALDTIRSGAQDILELEPADERWIQGAESICRESHGLLSTLHDVEEYTRIETGGLQAGIAPVSVRGLCTELLQLHGERARAKGLKLSFACESSVPERLLADAERLRRILGVLLDEALAATPAGSVDLAVDSERHGEWSDGGVRFRVFDGGPAISDEDRSRLFEPIGPESGAGRRGGLTLSLCWRIARILHCDLRYLGHADGRNAFALIVPALEESERGASV